MPLVWSTTAPLRAAGIQGHYANYWRYCERGRSDWLRLRNWSHERLRTEESCVFAVRNVAGDYLQAAQLEDTLCVLTRAHIQGRSQVLFSQCLLRINEEADSLLSLNAAALPQGLLLTLHPNDNLLRKEAFQNKRIFQGQVMVVCLKWPQFIASALPKAMHSLFREPVDD